jgi:hypothetical protein
MILSLILTSGRTYIYLDHISPNREYCLAFLRGYSSYPVAGIRS